MQTAVALSQPIYRPPVASNGVFEVLRTYRRRLPIFLGVAGLILLCAAVYTFSQVPQYTAQTTIVVEPRKAEVGSDRSSPLSDPTTDSSVDTQVEVLRAPVLIEAVIDQLGLADGQQLRRLTYAPGWLERLGLAKPDAQPLDETGRKALAFKTVVGGLDVRRVAQTFVLELDFTATDRRLAAQVANAFATAYVQQSLQLKLRSANGGSRQLLEQLDKARSDLTVANAAEGRYRIAHNLMSVGGATLAEQQLTAFDQQLSGARATEAEARARLATASAQLAAGSDGTDVGEALTSPVVQDLRRQRAELSRRVSEMSTRYGPRFPAVSAAQSQLQDVDDQIHGEIARVVSNLSAQVAVASRGRLSVEESLGRARGAVAANNVANVRLAELQLRANAARSLYEELLTRVREIGTQAATTQPDARIGSMATAPSAPSSPNIVIDLLVGVLLAVAGGIAAVVIRQGLDQGLSNLEDVEARLGLPYLAGLPTLRSSVARPRNSDPLNAVVAYRESAYAEAFRNLSAAVMQGGSRSVRTIVVTSALPNEGKTTASICFARILAMSGKRVVLVDADFRHASVARALGLRPQIGLREVIEDGVAITDALIDDEPSGLKILPLLRESRFVISPPDDPRFDRLIHDLSLRFDVVIFDVSPIVPVIDGRLLARKADAVILLARWRKTPEAAIEFAMHLLKQVGVVATGVALSRVDLSAASRSGYGDPANFLKRYESYYRS